MIRSTYARRLLALAGALALAACAAGGGTRAKPEDFVQQRAIERWNLLIAGDFAKAYDYLSPGFRSTRSREEYAQSLAGRPIRWQTVAPYSAECEPERCTITVTIESEVTVPGAMASKVRYPAQIAETWILSDRRWYFVPDEIAKGGP